MAGMRLSLEMWRNQQKLNSRLAWYFSFLHEEQQNDFGQEFHLNVFCVLYLQVLMWHEDIS